MPKQVNRQQDFSFVIKKQLGILSTAQTGWNKEVNLVEWNTNPAKLDIRDWDPEHEHMGRGITLHKPEVLALLEILLKHFGKDLAEARIKAKAEEAEAAEMDGSDAGPEPEGHTEPAAEKPICDEETAW